MTQPPATPPPFEPPVPVADGGTSGGGSKRRPALVAVVGAVAIAVAVLFFAGGDEDEPADPTRSPSVGGTSDPGEVASTLPEGFADGAELEELFTERYQEELGISERQAECLAEHVSEGIQEGQLTEEQAMAEILGFLDRCDISLEDLGGG